MVAQYISRVEGPHGAFSDPNGEHPYGEQELFTLCEPQYASASPLLNIKATMTVSMDRRRKIVGGGRM